MGALKQINLYQAEFRPIQVVLPARSLLFGMALLLAGFVAMYAWGEWRLGQFRQQVASLSVRAERLAAQVERLGAPGQTDARLVSDAMAMEGRIRILQLAQEAVEAGSLGSDRGFAEAFRALARSDTPGTWLTRVEMADRGREMNLHGRALTGEDPARLVASLRREPTFLGLSYAALDVRPPKEKAAEGAAPDVTKSGKPPRFLEFSLHARLPESTPATSSVPTSGGRP